jgi:predicted MFS family arabinose efflux permease
MSGIAAPTAETSTSRNFWTYWAASATSSVGTAITGVALPLTAISVLDATALEVSVITAASYVAWLVIGLPAGVISQRLPLRGVQVSMDLTRLLAIASIPFAWYADRLTVAHLALAALVVSFSSVLFEVSNSTFLPSIVPREQLAGRNSLNSATHATTELAGPSLGGLLVQTAGAVPALIADAISYLVSAVLLRTLPARQVDRPDAWPRVGAMIREGWRFVVDHPVMRPSMACATAINFVCGGLLALVPLYLVRGLEVSPLLVGLLLATEGVGSLVGASLTPWLVRRVGSGRAVRLAAVFSAVAVLLLPLTTGSLGIALFALGNAGFAAGVVVFSICTRTDRQLASPPQLLSRVMATVRFVSWGAIPIGSLTAGLVASILDVRGALTVFCLLAALTPVVVFSSRLRDVVTLEDLDLVPDAHRSAGR